MDGRDGHVKVQESSILSATEGELDLKVKGEASIYKSQAESHSMEENLDSHVHPNYSVPFYNY